MTKRDDGMAEHDTDDGFWSKLAAVATSAGRGLIEDALHLYFAVQDPAVPTWARSVCIGALGYFICPLDAMPDPIYIDDAIAIAAALGGVAIHVTPETKAKAKASDWLD